jgi:hypothetical protein
MGVYVVGLSTDEAKVVCVQPLKPLQLLEVAEPGRAELQYRLWHLLSLIPIAANPKLVTTRNRERSRCEKNTTIRGCASPYATRAIGALGLGLVE